MKMDPSPTNPDLEEIDLEFLNTSIGQCKHILFLLFPRNPDSIKKRPLSLMLLKEKIQNLKFHELPFWYLNRGPTIKTEIPASVVRALATGWLYSAPTLANKC